MAEFLIETYLAGETASAGALRIDDVARAADQVSQRGTEVRFLRAIFIPEEETCFYLYESSCADAVREAGTRARLPFERITEAVSIEGPYPRRNPQPKPKASPNQPTSPDRRKPDVTEDPAPAH